MVVDDGTAYAAWADEVNGFLEVVAAWSNNLGATWSARGSGGRVSMTPTESTTPALAVGNRKKHVVYSDDAPKNFEILYARRA